MWWPLPEHVHAVNEACVQSDPVDRKHGGGVRVPGLVESILADATPRAVASDDELVRSAALVLRGLAVGHPFEGCNKRTAFTVVAATLRANGWILEIPEGEVSRFMRDLTATRPPASSVDAWLRQHLRKG